ncbi:hypothetical protein Sjap_007525 [Stephania japonica]|uniref:Uncharacterized protein n=1 Tax=Stephania japonica TaxID=461633 RepID=A0AAP0PDM1_9MAGN
MGSGAFVLNNLGGTRLVKSGILSLGTRLGYAPVGASAWCVPPDPHAGGLGWAGPLHKLRSSDGIRCLRAEPAQWYSTRETGILSLRTQNVRVFAGIISQHRMFLSEEEGLQIRTVDFVDDLIRLRPDCDGNEWVSQSDDEKISEYKGLKLQEAVEWVVKNRLDEGQVWMIAVSSEGEAAYRFNSNAIFRGCATEDGFMEVGIWE